HRLQLRLTLLGLGLSLAYLLTVLLTGASLVVAHWAARLAPGRWGQVGLVPLVLGAGHGGLGLPVTLLRSYWLPRRFGLLHRPLGGWLADRVKAMVIGGVLGLAALELVYALLAVTPLWWLVAAAIFIGAQVALTAVLPVWIVPLFYRLVPLADDRLRERLLALARRAGVDAIGVFVADQSRKSRTANAAVVGHDRQCPRVHRRDGAARPPEPRRATPQSTQRDRPLLAPGARAQDRPRHDGPRRPRMTACRQTLRALVAKKGGLVVPGAYDGIS